MAVDLRNDFIRIARDWKDYGEKKKSTRGASIEVIDSKDPLHEIITSSLPSKLTTLNNQKSFKEYLLTKGSLGDGIKTLAPWIATFHSEITSSAKRGFYPVYLYSGDLINLYLSIALGVTAFVEIFGKDKKSLKAIRSAALKKRSHSKELLEENLNERIREKLIKDSIDVARGDKKFLHRAYGEGTIFSLEYKLEDLPSNEILLEDYDQLLNLYKSMVMDLTSPDVEELAVSEAMKEEKQEVTVINFEIRPPKKPSGKSGSGTGGEKRRSRKSTIVGNEAEEIVFKYEQKKVLELGFLDLEVIWCQKNPKDSKPGYDVLSFNEKGEEIYIEVKGAEGNEMTAVNLTSHEWEVANDSFHKSNYFIYLVFEALTKPRIEIIKNPAKLVEDGSLEIKIKDYDLRLHSVTHNERI